MRLTDSVRSFEEKHTFTLPTSTGSSTEQAKAGSAAAAFTGLHDFGGLEFDKYDDFNILARRISEVTADISESMTQLSGSIRRSHEDMSHLQQLTLGMRDEIARARMVPIGTPFTRFRRATREMARATGKEVTLVTSGEHTEVDTGVVERLVDPLVHLVRNAVYHGIEPAALRVSKGKPAAGTIYLHASHRGNAVLIEVEDDGAGLDIDKIRAKALERGLVRSDVAKNLPEAEAIKFIFKTTGLVVYGSPERAAMALSRLARYGAFQRRAAEREKEVLPDPALSNSTVRLLSDRHSALNEHEAKLLLRECGVPVVREEIAKTLDEALSQAEKIGYPVCLKVVSPQILHKTEVGGVALNIGSPEDLKTSYDGIMKNARSRMPHAEILGVLVQEMIGDGTEVIVGVSQDPQFGPVVLFGLGGIFVEALTDVSLRVAPVSRAEAWDMVNEIKGAQVLKGFRGKPPADVDSIVDVLVRLSSFASSQKDRIAEIDINPLIVREKGRGARAVDALVVLR